MNRVSGYSFDHDWSSSSSSIKEHNGTYKQNSEETMPDMKEKEAIKEGSYSSGDDSTSVSGSSNSDDKGKKKKEKPKQVGVAEIFRYATASDKLLMLLGLIGACVHGAAMPVMIIIFGDMSDLFIYVAQWEYISNQLAANISDACSMLCNQGSISLTSISPTRPSFCTAGGNQPTSRPIFQQTTVSYEPLCDWCTNVTGAYITENIQLVIKALENFGCTDQVDVVSNYLQYIDSDLLSKMSTYALYYTYIGCGVLVVAYFQLMCWYRVAYNQSERIRSRLFKSILRQEIGWFDTHEVGELNTRMVDDVDQIEKGIGDKLALLFQYFSAFIAGFVIGFIYGWKLTLVILSVAPLLAISGGVMAQIISLLTKKELAAYAKAGAVAEEVFSAIRTVTAFGGQEKEAKRYYDNLSEARTVGMKKGYANGLGLGAVFLVMFGSYALAFWYGSTLVLEEDYTPGSMMIVFFCILIGSFSLGAGAPNIQDFANARGAAYVVFGIIDQVSPIDSSSEGGIKPEKLTGNIEFRDAVFRYPSRPDVKVMNGLSMKVNVGQTIALVGSSGCGKSTCVQLLQRFYDVISGEVLIDGIDIRKYNIKWLRQHIGVVSQEPVLFATTIAQNIRNGREDATQEEIEQAAKKANAHDFISKLPLKYETLVGERGAQLSGGQKQRIAIARALIRDPTILLLDEATSALDTESEGIVQSALDKAREGRTTIVIAHRLSTIQTADIIAGVSNGVIVEQGTHEELMSKNGVYHSLVTNQKHMLDGDDDEDNSTDKLRAMSVKKDTSHPAAVERMRSMSIASQRKDSVLHKEMDEQLADAPMKRVMQLNSPEWLLITIGCLAALIMGCVQPAFAIIFSNILGVFSVIDEAEKRRKCDFYSGMFAVIGVIAFVSTFVQNLMFARSGEHLTTRLRDKTFRSLMRKEIAYFDDPLNSTGALCSRLSTDAAAVKGATGSRLATFIQSFGSIGFGVIIGFIYSWQLTLALLAFAPFLLATGAIEMRIMQGDRGERSKKMEDSAKIAVEAIENIRTVATLTQENKLHTQFADLINVPYNASRRKAHFIGFAFGASQAIVFFANSACFYFGSWLVTNKGLSYENMFKCFTCVLFGAMAAGQASSFAPDYGKAKMAAARLFALFDHVPSIDSISEEGDKLDDFSGSVEFSGVQFHYPSRPDVQVLKGLNIKIQPGQVVALVGSSGCGKSTVVQLLERFYDPISGHVLVDGHQIESLHLQWLRRQIGIVSQEPILFDCSIRDNIAYGDNFREVTMDEIIEAARMANIHNFINSLPQGYDTNVGDKGAQLSGGQKQRIAIARALVRSPKILLLDEATSALDTESEKVVQEALERAQEGRTSIVIAHRLSTIQNADCIIVIDSGRIAEMGTHNELIAKQGIYYRLNKRQTAKK